MSVNARVAAWLKDKTKPIPRAAFGLCNGSVDESGIGEQFGGDARQHGAFPAALAELLGHARRTDHTGRIHAGDKPSALKWRGLYRGTIRTQEAGADFEVARPPLIESLNRLEQDLHTVGGNSLGCARKPGVRQRGCTGTLASASVRPRRAHRRGAALGRVAAGLGGGPPGTRRLLGGHIGGRPHRGSRCVERRQRAGNHGILGLTSAGGLRGWGRIAQLVSELLDQVLDEFDVLFRWRLRWRALPVVDRAVRCRGRRWRGSRGDARAAAGAAQRAAGVPRPIVEGNFGARIGQHVEIVGAGGRRNPIKGVGIGGRGGKR